MKYRALLVGTLVATLACLASLWILGSIKQPTILAGMRIGVIAVGGLTEKEAETVIQDAAERLKNAAVQIDNQTYPIALADWGVRIEAAATARRAAALGESDHRLVAGWNRLRSFFRVLTITATLAVNEERLEHQASDLAALASLPEQDATLVFANGAWTVSADRTGRTIEAAMIRQKLLNHVAQFEPQPLALTTTAVPPRVTADQATALLSLAKHHTQTPINLKVAGETITVEPSQLAGWTEIVASDDETPIQIRLNASQIEAYVKTLAARFNTAPVDARVAFRDGAIQIVQDSQVGRRLDDSAAAKALVAAWSNNERELELKLDEVIPEVNSANLTSLGLQGLVGQATTSYVGSPENRKYNIANGVSFLNSKLVKPGAEFSTVAALGAIDDTTGYLPELVIKENRTTPEYGGGLCQVSTTLFRAALAAGLKITERQNHSYRVGYYERGVGPGLDATIYLPAPDLKFLNDTPGWLLIQGYVTPEKNEITFEFYGTGDGRRSQIGPPQISDVTPAPAPIYVETADLETGKLKQIEKPHEGAKTVVSYQVFNADGSTRFEQTFRSTYKAWPARYLVGTGPAPETPTDSSTP